MYLNVSQFIRKKPQHSQTKIQYINKAFILEADRHINLSDNNSIANSADEFNL